MIDGIQVTINCDGFQFEGLSLTDGGIALTPEQLGDILHLPKGKAANLLKMALPPVYQYQRIQTDMSVEPIAVMSLRDAELVCCLMASRGNQAANFFVERLANVRKI